MSKVTRKQAEKVVELVHKAFPAYVQTFARDADGKSDYDTIVPETDERLLPRLVEDHDGYAWAIVWEDSSPYCWTYNFPHGGTDEEFGGTVKDVSASMPAGVTVEALTSYSIGIYKEV